MQISNPSSVARLFHSPQQPTRPHGLPGGPHGGPRRATFQARPSNAPEGPSAPGAGSQSGRLDQVEERIESLLARLEESSGQNTGRGGPRRLVGRIDELVRQEIRDLAQTFGADNPELDRELRELSRNFREGVRSAVSATEGEGGFDVDGLAAAVESTFDAAIGGLRSAFDVDTTPPPVNPGPRTAEFAAAPVRDGGAQPPVPPAPEGGTQVEGASPEGLDQPGPAPAPEGPPNAVGDQPPLRLATDPVPGSEGSGNTPGTNGGGDVNELLDALAESFRGLLGQLQGLGGDSTRIAISLYAEFGGQGGIEAGSLFDLQS